MYQRFDYIGPYDDSKVPSNEQLNLFYDEDVKPENSERNEVIGALNADMDIIWGFVNGADTRFSKTDVIRLGSAYQGLKVGRADEFDFTLCLNYISIDETWHIASSISATYYGFDGFSDDNAFWTKAHTSPQKRPDGSYTNIHKTVDKSHTIIRKQHSLKSPGVGYVVINLTGKLLKTFKNPLNLTFHGGVSKYRNNRNHILFSKISSSNLIHRFPGIQFDRESAHLIPFQVKLRLKELLGNALTTGGLKFTGAFTLCPAAHGPALTLKYEHPGRTIDFPISIDISPAVRSTWSFERLGVNWPRSDSRWPSRETIDLIRSKGVLYVAKQNFDWRLSFAECEKTLCKSEDCGSGCRKKVHRIMKYLHKELWSTNTNPLISAYIVKNVWLWEMEKYPDNAAWVESLLRVRLFWCIHSLINYVLNCIDPQVKASLPQYFDPRHNLLEGKDEDQLAEECDIIEQFYKNP